MSPLIITAPGTRAGAMMRQIASACLPARTSPLPRPTQEPTVPQTNHPLRYSIVSAMAQKAGKPSPESKPFSLADAMRQKVERDRSAR